MFVCVRACVCVRARVRALCALPACAYVHNLPGLGSSSLLFEFLFLLFGAVGLGLLKLSVSWDIEAAAGAAADQWESGQLIASDCHLVHLQGLLGLGLR